MSLPLWLVSFFFFLFLLFFSVPEMVNKVAYITGKASKGLYFLKQLQRAGVPHQQLLHFHTAVIHPVLKYCTQSSIVPWLEHRLNSWSRHKSEPYIIFILLLWAYLILIFCSLLNLPPLNPDMTANLLTLNSSKTEFLLIGLKKQLDKIHNSTLTTTHLITLKTYHQQLPWLHLWRTSHLFWPNFNPLQSLLLPY